MRLSQLLEAIEHRTCGGGDPEIAAVTHDSRQVREGTLFAAFRGLKHDARAFIPDAIAAGAAAVLAEGEPPAPMPVPFVSVAHARRAAGAAAARLAGDPAEKLVMVGVTGTSGKTTTTLLVDRMLRDHVGPTGLFGTLVYRGAGATSVEASRTTPEATELQPMLGALVRAGGAAAVMECSSHAIDLERLSGCRFDVAAFTNLSRDHLDYHRDLGEYYEAKARLFTLLKPSGRAVVNADDDWGRRLLQGLPAPAVAAYSLRDAPGATVRGEAAIGPAGTTVRVIAPGAGTFTITSPLLGRPNAENLLAAAAIGLALGIEPDRIAGSLRTVDCIPGRMEVIPNALGVVALVDYAHKPGALEGALRTCRQLAAPGGRVVAVFGCGGDRDRGKRPEMGRIAAALADEFIVTSDNPRSEDPAAIAAEILAGAEGRPPAVILDRGTAIVTACRRCRRGDVLLIAGKGHERYQEITGRKEPFDERAIARSALAAIEQERLSAGAGPS